MLTGDSLTVFFGLLSFAGGAGIAGYTVEGARRRNLYITAAVLCVLAVLYAFVPVTALGSPEELVQRLVLAVPVITVALLALTRHRAVPAQPAPKDETKTHREALTQIARAIGNADWEDLRVPEASAASSLAVLNSCFATLRKVYNLEPPDLRTPNAASLKKGVAYLRAVQPFLTAGHVEEARAASADFLRR